MILVHDSLECVRAVLQGLGTSNVLELVSFATFQCDLRGEYTIMCEMNVTFLGLRLNWIEIREELVGRRAFDCAPSHHCALRWQVTNAPK